MDTEDTCSVLCSGWQRYPDLAALGLPGTEEQSKLDIDGIDHMLSNSKHSREQIIFDLLGRFGN